MAAVCTSLAAAPRGSLAGSLQDDCVIRSLENDGSGTIHAAIDVDRTAVEKYLRTGLEREISKFVPGVTAGGMRWSLKSPTILSVEIDIGAVIRVGAGRFAFTTKISATAGAQVALAVGADGAVNAELFIDALAVGLVKLKGVRFELPDQLGRIQSVRIAAVAADYFAVEVDARGAAPASPDSPLPEQ